MAGNKTFVQQAFDFGKYIIDRSGMRSLIALIVDSALLYLVYILIKGCDYDTSLIYALLASLVIITITFFIMRHFERRGK